MAYFTYKAKDGKGQIISGTLEADNRTAAVSRLQVMGYFPIDVKGGEEEKGIGESLRRGRMRVKTRDLTAIYRQLSDLVGAGVPLVKAIEISKSQCPHEGLKTLLSKIDQDVQGGDTFARALGRHPQVFSRLSVALINAGEKGGLLDETLNRLADFSEAEEEMMGRIKGALAYPAIMSVAGALAIAVLFTFVIPRIVGALAEFNQALPAMTQVLITMSDFLGNYWLFLLGGAAVCYLSFRRYVATEAGRLQFDGMMLRIPLLGDVILKREISRFTRTLGSLLRNGVPILEALEISKEVLSNAVIRTEIDAVPEGISQGGGMAGTLRKSPFFPPVVTNMIAVGEETGNLPGVLLKVADTYEKQVDRSVKTLTSLLEPMIILAMGLVVGFIVIAMLLPIFELDPTGGA